MNVEIRPRHSADLEELARISCAFTPRTATPSRAWPTHSRG